MLEFPVSLTYDFSFSSSKVNILSGPYIAFKTRVQHLDCIYYSTLEQVLEDNQVIFYCRLGDYH